MYILTSLGRPERIRAVVDSYDWGVEKIILALYDKDPKLSEYLAQEWPETWKIETVGMKGNGPTYNEILARYPNERCYGFLADDAILDEQGMLRMLEMGADDWRVAYANDKHWGAELATMPCIGGKLVRAVGYLSPPGLMHWAIDNAWTVLGKKLDCLKYFPALTYTHLNPVWGTAPDDPTYRGARNASFGWEQIVRAWIVNEIPLIVERVRAAQKERVAA